MARKKSDFEITKMRRKDLDEVVDLLGQAFGRKHKELARGDLRMCFVRDAGRRPVAYVARKNGEIVGAVQSHTCFTAWAAREFSWLATKKRVRGEGIGKALLRHAEQEAITHQFNGASGTFLINVIYDPGYYRSMGYKTGGLTDDAGNPFMVKHHRPKTKRRTPKR